jgi:hypothetical protein
MHTQSHTHIALQKNLLVLSHAIMPLFGTLQIWLIVFVDNKLSQRLKIKKNKYKG